MILKKYGKVLNGRSILKAKTASHGTGQRTMDLK